MSSAIIPLSHDKFTVIGRTTKAMITNISGPSVIMFTASGCSGCHQMRPVFDRLAREFGGRGTTFGIADVSGGLSNRILQMSRGTTTPINFTPMILYYAGGRPRERYSGGLSLEELREFVGNALEKHGGGGPPAAPRPSAAYGGGGGRPPQAHGGWGDSGGGRIDRTMYQPDVSAPSNMSGMTKGGGYDGEDGEGDTLLLPTGVVPKNQPWLCHTGLD